MKQLFPTPPATQPDDQAGPSQASHAGRLVIDKNQPVTKQQESGGTFQGVILTSPTMIAQEDLP